MLVDNNDNSVDLEVGDFLIIDNTGEFITIEKSNGSKPEFKVGKTKTSSWRVRGLGQASKHEFVNLIAQLLGKNGAMSTDGYRFEIM